MPLPSAGIAACCCWALMAPLAAADAGGGTAGGTAGGDANGPPSPSYVTRISGEVLHANTLEFAGLAFRDVVAKPLYEGDILDFSDCQATAYGGRVTGSIELNLDTGSYHCRCEVLDVDLGTVLSEFGGNNAGVTGTVAGRAEFDIPARHPELMTGSGELAVTKASLVQLPLLTNLLIGDPGASRNKDIATARFSFSDGHINIIAGKLSSPACKISFHGTIGFDGDLRVYLIPRFKFDIFESIPGVGGFVADFLGNITSRVARALIRGQVTKPVLIINPFLRQP
jgi:hypothetical protein